MDAPIKNKEKRKEWTWKHQTDLVKWQPVPLENSLLRLDETDLNPLAMECFDCILRYCGDLPLTPDTSEVKCVYTVLMVSSFFDHTVKRVILAMFVPLKPILEML